MVVRHVRMADRIRPLRQQLAGDLYREAPAAAVLAAIEREQIAGFHDPHPLRFNKWNGLGKQIEYHLDRRLGTFYHFGIAIEGLRTRRAIKARPRPFKAPALEQG